MDTICPVCNGLSRLSARCPVCGSAALDQGRMQDQFGPYSPYGSIEQASASNGLPDLALGACAHTAFCRNCAHAFPVYIQEFSIGD
ncbi:hypothetical protein [Gorillibacterium sp. CAU 1737]|uniref:hypothetical protein n=1 Tax=Gorillibacterium sp. CAU 1737 TaxID=3140362 RepID=UPI003261B38A